MMLDSTHNKIRFSEDGCVKLNLAVTQGEIGMLDGKYSESFVRELVKQLTAAIESSLGVVGLSGSTIEIDMVYSPESFMEHITDGVTYRRLLMSAKGCAPRDLWIKWRTRTGETVSSAAAADSDGIEFFIGEDVPHKVREREYRYLVHGNSDKYRTAMGKKNITEWRDIVKRAVKRGELSRTAPEAEISQHSEEVADKLADLLERFNINLPKDTDDTKSASDDIAELAKAKLLQRGIADESADEPYFPEDTVSDGDPDANFVGDFISSLEVSSQSPPEDEPPFEAEVQIAVPSKEFDIPTFAAGKEPDFFEPPFIPEEAKEEIAPKVDTDAVLRESALKAELDSVKAERDALASEIENLKSALAAVKDTFGKAMAELTAERDSLRSQLELEAAARQREKTLFAEAARQAKEESDRIIRECEAELQRKAEDEARLAEEKQKEAELAQEEEMLRAEVERIERDMKVSIDGKRTALERAQELSRAMEREALLKVQSIGLSEPKPTSAPAYVKPVQAPAPQAEPAPKAEPAKPTPIGPENHPYTSVSAKLIFRHNVDPNVKGRLYEIISRALEYYKKEHVYIKLKASIPEPAAVMLNFEQFPEGEDELLRGIVKLIGNSDLGVMKIIVE